jgi:polar amino acid transport system substrate-binding protein
MRTLRSNPTQAERTRRLRPQRAAIGVTVLLVLTACGGEQASLPSPIEVDRITLDAPGAFDPGPCQDNGDPKRSFQPTGSLPTPGAMPDGSVMADILEAGRLRLGTSADTLQFAARNPQTNVIEGFDVDMAALVAEAIFGDSDDRIEFVVLPYSQRLPALRAGTVDLVAQTMTINCPRWNAINFSAEYFTSSSKTLVRKGAVSALDAPFDALVADEALRFCAPDGSTNLEFLQQSGIRDDRISVVTDITDCLVLFQQSTVGAIVSDDTVLAGFGRQDPNAEVLSQALTSEPYGLGVANGDGADQARYAEFTRFVNGVLDEAKRDGRWQERYDFWLGSLLGPAEPPVSLYGREE